VVGWFDEAHWGGASQPWGKALLWDPFFLRVGLLFFLVHDGRVPFLLFVGLLYGLGGGPPAAFRERCSLVVGVWGLRAATGGGGQGSEWLGSYFV